MDPDREGVYTVFEGGEMVGKDIQALALVAAIGFYNRTVARRDPLKEIPLVFVREPGTVLYSDIKFVRGDWVERNQTIRETLKYNEKLEWKEQLYLFMLARDNLIEGCIAPVLKVPGVLVVSLRDVTSSWVYQGMIGGVSPEKILLLEEASIGRAKANLTLILDITIEEFKRRRITVMAEGRVSVDSAPIDAFDRRELEFHKSVFDAYRIIAECPPEYGERLLINGMGSYEEVLKRIIMAFEERIYRANEWGYFNLQQRLHRCGFRFGDLTAFVVDTYRTQPDMLSLLQS